MFINGVDMNIKLTRAPESFYPLHLQTMRPVGAAAVVEVPGINKGTYNQWRTEEGSLGYSNPPPKFRRYRRSPRSR